MNGAKKAPAEAASRAIEWQGEERGFLVEDGVRRPFAAVASERDVWVRWRGRTYRVRPEAAEPSAARPEPAAGTVAPMPGVVRSVRVREGEEVAAGAVLLVMEAMKMEHEVRATAPARVISVRAREGERVDAGARLIELEPLEESR